MEHLRAAAQVLLKHAAQDEAQHNGRHAVAQLVCKIADHAERQHDPHVKHVVAGAERADGAQHDHDGGQHIAGDAQDLHKQPDAEGLEHHHGAVCDQQRRKNAIHGGHVVHKQHGPAPQPVDQQPAHHNGGRGVPRDAQRHHGHHGAAGHGVVAGFAGDHALNVALAELLRRFGQMLCGVIGHKAGNAAARAGQDPDDGPQKGRGEQDLPLAEQQAQLWKFRPDLAPVCDLRLGVGGAAHLVFRLQHQSFLYP